MEKVQIGIKICFFFMFLFKYIVCSPKTYLKETKTKKKEKKKTSKLSREEINVKKNNYVTFLCNENAKLRMKVIFVLVVKTEIENKNLKLLLVVFFFFLMEGTCG